jgi:hypothetical protein
LSSGKDNTLTPEQRLEDGIRNTLGKTNVKNAQKIWQLNISDVMVSRDNKLVTIKELFVEFTIDEQWNEKWGKFSLATDVKNILEEVQQATEVPVDSVRVQARASMIDVYGGTQMETGFRAKYKRETIAKIQFDKFINENVFVIADEPVFLHPAFNK